MPILHVILAVLCHLGASGLADDLDPPRKVTFRLADGVRFVGDMTKWDRDSFDGTFGRRLWIELHPDDGWRLFRSLMDDQSARHWLDLARVFMQIEKQEARVENALRTATRLDPEVAPEIPALRAEAVELVRERREREEARARNTLQTTSPEARPWPADPWPVLTTQEQAAARLSVIGDAEAMLRQAGLTHEPVESDYFIIYSDAPRLDVAGWAVRLDRRCRELLQLLGMAENVNPFWGKAVVFVFEEGDQFRLFEAGAFRFYATNAIQAITHYSGPKAFIVAARQKDGVLHEHALAREMVHAVLHRTHAPRRLPPWANEGLAEFIAQKIIDGSTIHDGLRPVALRLIRTGQPLRDIVDATWESEFWPGRDNAGPAIGHLMSESLVKSTRAACGEWVKLSKTGTDWREAMTRTFGGTVEQFLEAFVRYFRVND
ncbi:MAG: hypothetical protein KJZ68_00565 [Phycisphaerales bacterium]|nr:hypothetical protein [Phycisphaerales bacterium]